MCGRAKRKFHAARATVLSAELFSACCFTGTGLRFVVCPPQPTHPALPVLFPTRSAEENMEVLPTTSPIIFAWISIRSTHVSDYLPAKVYKGRNTCVRVTCAYVIPKFIKRSHSPSLTPGRGWEMHCQYCTKRGTSRYLPGKSAFSLCYVGQQFS